MKNELVNPFYFPSADSTGDDEYKYANYKEVTDRDPFVDAEKKDLFSAAQKLELARYIGPPHKHVTIGVPREAELEEIYTTPPLEVMICPECGGDTLWTSGVAAQAEGARAHWVACGKGIRREHPARRSGPPSDPMEENPCKPELHASQGLNP
ncbi:hypothetical protein BKA82DRAFT_4011001 [Pisolithus tinctorius]|nr:hypothetical protein BKA82DRAFT_4011001 [Pisolithus tinctorius]